MLQVVYSHTYNVRTTVTYYPCFFLAFLALYPCALLLLLVFILPVLLLSTIIYQQQNSIALVRAEHMLFLQVFYVTLYVLGFSCLTNSLLN